MPTYDSLVSRTDAGPLIPEEVSRQIIQSLPATSVALASFRQVRMGRAQQRLPILSVLPTAYWVGGSDTGRKQTTEINWDNLYLDARELAVIVPVPEAVLDDSDYPIWDEVRPRIGEAIGAKIDAAALFGTDRPAGWPTSILEKALAAGNEAVVGDGVDLVDDINNAWAKVEEDGFDVNVQWARRNIRSRLRGLRDEVGQPIYLPSLSAGSPATVMGEPLLIVDNGAWDSERAMVVGDRRAAILGIRQDISFKVFTEGVISNDDGDVVLNLMQQDAVALRVTMRVAYNVANPINRQNTNSSTRFPFAVLSEAGS